MFAHLTGQTKKNVGALSAVNNQNKSALEPNKV